MFKFNNSIVPNKVRIGWHFSSNIYVYRDAYLALKSKGNVIIPLFVPFVPVYIAVTYLYQILQRRDQRSTM